MSVRAAPPALLKVRTWIEEIQLWHLCATKFLWQRLMSQQFDPLLVKAGWRYLFSKTQSPTRPVRRTSRGLTQSQLWCLSPAPNQVLIINNIGEDGGIWNRTLGVPAWLLELNCISSAFATRQSKIKTFINWVRLFSWANDLSESFWLTAKCVCSCVLSQAAAGAALPLGAIAAPGSCCWATVGPVTHAGVDLPKALLCQPRLRSRPYSAPRCHLGCWRSFQSSLWGGADTMCSSYVACFHSWNQRKGASQALDLGLD